MGPQNHLSITVCRDAEEATQKGFHYSTSNDYKLIEITQVVVVQDGTLSGGATVDLILTDESGQKFVVMLTGALLKSIPC